MQIPALLETVRGTSLCATRATTTLHNPPPGPELITLEMGPLVWVEQEEDARQGQIGHSNSSDQTVSISAKTGITTTSSGPCDKFQFQFIWQTHVRIHTRQAK